MGAAGLAVGLGSMAIQTILAMKGQGDEASAKKTEALDNIRLAGEAAADATARGNQEAGRARTQGTKMIAAQHLAYANSGIDPTVGTPADVMADTAATTELDARTLENNAAREAWGFKSLGAKFSRQSAIDQQRYSNQQAATLLGAAGQMSKSVADYIK